MEDQASETKDVVKDELLLDCEMDETDETVASDGDESHESDMETNEIENEEAIFEMLDTPGSEKVDIPSKSSNVYLIRYNKFMKWRKDNGKQNFSEALFLEYFKHLNKNYQASTLWTFYSIIRTMVLAKHNLDIRGYLSLASYLKKVNKGYVAKKAKRLSAEQVYTFLQNAPNQQYLATKVCITFILIIIIYNEIF